jgi:YidC/Oxa1 family membrane protein insertase
MEKRALLAAILCLAILYIWSTYVSPPSLPPPSKAPEQKKIEQKEKKKKRKKPSQKEQRPPEKEIILKNKFLKASFTTYGGTVKHWVLKSKQYQRVKGKRTYPVDLVTTKKEEFLPLRLYFLKKDFEFSEKPVFDLLSQTENQVVFRWKSKEVLIQKSFTLAKQPYQMWLVLKVTNLTQSKQRHKLSLELYGWQNPKEKSSSFFGPLPNVVSALCMRGETLERRESEELEEEEMSLAPGQIRWLAIDETYFVSAIITGAKGVYATCKAGVYPQGIIKSHIALEEEELQPKASQLYRFRIYMGPKDIKYMNRTGTDLEKSIDYYWDWLAPICRVMLWIMKLSYQVVPNWGIAIIVLTILIKFLLLPLTQKGFKSMRKMQEIKPVIDRINELYKDNKEKRAQEMMRIYREYKINPLGGCLPMLLQMPVYFALYSTLRVSVELYRSKFVLWIKDLSRPDPYYVLPILLGISMFLQQKFTPSTMDTAQAKMMMYFMPLLFTFFMLFLPSGLTLYILVNTLLSIGHYKFMYSRSKNV